MVKFREKIYELHNTNFCQAVLLAELLNRFNCQIRTFLAEDEGDDCAILLSDASHFHQLRSMYSSTSQALETSLSTELKFFVRDSVQC